jgi:hypothetical protein
VSDTASTAPVGAIVESDTAPEDVPRAALISSHVDPEHPSGFEPGTILKVAEGYFEQIVHEVDAETQKIVGWFKRRVNEDGSLHTETEESA